MPVGRETPKDGEDENLEDLCASPVSEKREQYQSVGDSWLSSEAKQGSAVLRLVLCGAGELAS